MCDGIRKYAAADAKSSKTIQLKMQGPVHAQHSGFSPFFPLGFLSLTGVGAAAGCWFSSSRVCLLGSRGNLAGISPCILRVLLVSCEDELADFVIGGKRLKHLLLS